MAMQGICKAVIAADGAARATGGKRLLDVGFIEEHTQGFETFADFLRALRWDKIEHYTALSRADHRKQDFDECSHPHP